MENFNKEMVTNEYEEKIIKCVRHFANKGRQLESSFNNYLSEGNEVDQYNKLL